MAYPTGTFNVPESGKLQITFSGKFSSHAQGGVPSWFGGSSTYTPFLRILCAAGGKEAMISMESPTAVIELDYTASTDVAASMALHSWGYGGLGGVAASQLLIRCILMKR